jgi:hypothetical protein
VDRRVIIMSEVKATGHSRMHDSPPATDVIEPQVASDERPEPGPPLSTDREEKTEMALLTVGVLPPSEEPDGEPQRKSGVRVSLTGGLLTTPSNKVTRQSTTAGWGEVTWDHLPIGEYRISLSKCPDGYDPPKEYTVTTDAETQTVASSDPIQLIPGKGTSVRAVLVAKPKPTVSSSPSGPPPTPSVRVTGELRLANADPSLLAGMPVKAVDAGEPTKELATATVDHEGKFTLSDLPRGAPIYVAFERRWHTSDGSLVVVRGDQRVELQPHHDRELTATPTYTIMAQVKGKIIHDRTRDGDAIAEPLAGVDVRVEDHRGNPVPLHDANGMEVDHVSSSETGEFVALTPASGPLILQFSPVLDPQHGPLDPAIPRHHVDLEPAQRFELAAPVLYRPGGVGPQESVPPATILASVPSSEEPRAALDDAAASGPQLFIRQEVFQNEQEPWSGLLVVAVDQGGEWAHGARTNEQGVVSIKVPTGGSYSVIYVDDSIEGEPAVLKKATVRVLPDGTISEETEDVAGPKHRR